MLRIRIDGRKAVALAIVALGAVAHAGSAQAATRAPVVLGPFGTVEYHANSPLEVQWIQDAAGFWYDEPRWFVICLSPQGSCGPMQAAASIPRTIIQSPPPPVFADYQYTFTLASVPPSHTDQALQLRVGACATQAVSSCTFSTIGYTWLMTRNLVPEHISLRYTSGYGIDLVVTAYNAGSTPSTGFVSRFQGWTAVAAQSGNTCETNVNRPRLDPNAIALTDTGEQLAINQLPIVDGQRDLGGRTVVAIYSDDEQSQVGYEDFDLDTESLPPGVAYPFELSQWSRMGMAQTIAVRYAVDTTNAVVEFDETDNAKGACFFIH